MTEQRPSPRGDVDIEDVTLRLLWPQWQGAGTASVQALAPEFPFEVARRGYAVGSAVLQSPAVVVQGDARLVQRQRDPRIPPWHEWKPTA